MNRTHVSALVLTLLALGAGTARAADASVDLSTARQNGELLASGELGVPLNQLYPQQYAQPGAQAAVSAAGKTRDQVRAELAAARRNGDLANDGDIGPARLNVSAVPRQTLDAAQPTPAKTRAQVRAEVLEARRSGDLIADGEAGVTLKELFPARYRRAI
jgi:hypothetical protein